MRTHEQIIGKGGDFARAIGSDPNVVNQWRRNDSIPAAYWSVIVKANLATLEELAAAAEARRPPKIVTEGAAA